MTIEISDIEQLIGGNAQAIADLREELETLRAQMRGVPFVYAGGGMAVQQLIADNTLTMLSWTNLDEDLTGAVSGDTLTVPRDGIYLVAASARFEINSTGTRRLALRQYDTAGTFARNLGAGTAPGDANREADVNAATIVRLDSGEKIKVGVLQDSGIAINVLTSATRVALMLLYC